MTKKVADLLRLARTVSEDWKLHIEVRVGSDVYVYEDGMRLLSNIDSPTKA